MSPHDLRTSIESGPLAAELAPLMAAGNEAGVADAFNRADREYARVVPIVELSGFLLTQGITGFVQAADEARVGDDIGTGFTMTFGIKVALKTYMTIIQNDYRLTTANMSEAVAGPVLDALQTIGAMSPEQRTALIGLTTSTRTLAQELWGESVIVTANDVSAAYGRI